MKLKTMPPWLWAAAIVPRVIMFGLAWRNPQACTPPDARTFLSLANYLWKEHRFTSPDLEEMFRVPGYPLFLAPFTGLFKEPTLWVAGVQCLLGLATVYLAWSWLRSIAGERAANVGAAILALDAVIIFHTPILLAETLALFLTLLALGMTWGAIHSERIQEVVLPGLLWGTLLLIKPVFILFPLTLLVVGWPRKKIILVFLVCAYLFPGMWVVRNGVVGHFWGLSTQSGFDLLKYPAASIEAMRTGKSWETAQVELQADVDAEDPQKRRSSVERSEASHKKASHILMAHPVLLMRYCAIGAVRILAGTGAGVLASLLSPQELPSPSWSSPEKHTYTYMRDHAWTVPFQALYVLALLTLYALAFKGCIGLWNSGQRAEAYLLAVGALYLLAVASHQGYSRFRVPMMPFLAAAAAFAFVKRPSQLPKE